jgi:hypothetical protein
MKNDVGCDDRDDRIVHRQFNCKLDSISAGGDTLRQKSQANASESICLRVVNNVGMVSGRLASTAGTLTIRLS